MTKVWYEASGSVRGTCGHRHGSVGTAYACVQTDRRAIARLGGGAFSDREVCRLDGEPLTDDEEAELEDIASSWID